MVYGASDKLVRSFCTDALMHTKKNLLNEYSNETEQSLKDQGYDEKFIAGLDYVNANLKLANSLRERFNNERVNPNTLHIPEFAELIDTHIAFIEEGIKSQSSTDKAERLELLERLKLEVQHRKSSETVTYRYFFNLNLRLSILATPKEERYEYTVSASEYNPQLEEGLDYLREWIVN